MKGLSRENFVKRYSPFVNEITKGSGIFAGTLFAQAILESSGKYKTGGQWLVGGSKLSQEANNYFGIKADKSWKGKRYNIATGENKPSGEYYVINDDFRAYSSVEDSLRDYINFLKTNPRYKKNGVFEAKNVKDQAEALKRSGYATAPNYAQLVDQVYNSVKKYISDAPVVKVISGAGIFALLVGAYFFFKQK
jgi:mannosyl-glycoprotein endo-beta-N-acetylglucosaminidase/stage II sporulation protein P